MVRTAGSALTTLALVLGGCSAAFDRGGDDGAERVPTEVADVLAAVGPRVIEPGTARFIASVGDLDDALDGWDGGTNGQAETQAAWTAAMLVWQECEVHQIGPAASSLTAVAGGDLRDAIYSWPTINPCRVDQETVAGGWDQPAYFDQNLVNVFGLDALEHLLFAEGTDNVCPSQVAINSDGSWDALGPAGVRAARLAHARALTTHLERTANALDSAWDGFDDDLASAGTATSPFDTSDAALNAIFDALFFIETSVKDKKLAVPLGLNECGTPTCPDDVEHLPSRQSTQAIAANLRGFRSMFTGGDGAGLDDLLVELGHGDLTEQILAATDAADATAAALELPLDDALAADPDGAQALHSAVGGVTDLLKGDLATVLALQIPAEAAGDND